MQTVILYIDNIKYNLYGVCIPGAGIPKFGLAIIKDVLVLDNVVAITLATRSVL